MNIFTRTGLAHKVLSVILNFLLVFYSVAPGINASVIYAQEASPSPTDQPIEASSPQPTEGITITPEPSPTVTPTAEPTVTPTPSPTPGEILSSEGTPTPQTENIPTPNPTENIGQPNAPPESPAPSVTLEPSSTIPNASVHGELAVSIVETSAVDFLNLDINPTNISSASLTTDKSDYGPTETVIISGSDFVPNTIYVLKVTSSDPPPVDFQTEVTTNDKGSFISLYQLDGIYRPNYKVEVKDSSGNVVALTTFTDSDSGFVAPNQTIASSSVSNPDNGWLSDDNRATFNNTNDTAYYGFPDLGIPAGATIDGIEVTIEGYQSGGKDLTAALWNISDSNPDAYTADKTATLSSSDSVQTLGGPTDKWGKTWTVSDFADADFKIGVATTGGSNDALLDQVRVKVYYTEEAPVCTSPPSGMTSWWPGEGNTDDIVGTNNGTAENGATFASGKVDQAFSFDGTNDWVAASNVGDFGSSPFTVDFWMKSNNDGSSNPTFIVGKNHADGGLGWDIRLSNSTIRVYGVNGWSLNIASDASATPNVWHHIALASTDTTVNLYIDGVLKGTSPRSAITSTSNPFRIGFTTDFQSPAFNGLIDEVEIFNRALSLSEIQAIYNADSAGKCKTEASPSPTPTPTPTPTPSPTPAPDLNWPTSWNTPNSCVSDPINDENPNNIDLVGTTGSPAVGFASDANYQYFREKVHGDPGTPASLVEKAWVVLFQTSTPQYQYLGSLNGHDDKVQLYQNTSPTGAVDFNPLLNDPAETLLWEASSGTYANVTSAGGGDFYIDWAIPTSELTTRGITTSTTKFFATSADANNFNKDHLLCYEALSDLSIVKTDSPDPVTNGGTLTYTLTVSNGGPDSASGVVVTDNLPTGYAVSSVTPSQGSCSDTTAPSISCELGSLANGATATVTIVGTITTDQSSVTNSASVALDTAVSTDTNSSNNSDSEDTAVNPAVGTIIVHKDVRGPNGENITDTAQNFTINLDGGNSQSLTDNGSYTYSDVAAGSHTVTEDTPPSGYDLYGISETAGGSGNTGGLSVSVTTGGTTHVYVTNRQQQTTLTITKTVTNDNGGTKEVSDFVLKIDGNNVVSGVANNVTPGSHTDSEVNLPGYSASSWGGDCNSDGTITLALGDNKTCTITNNDIAPSLTLVKTVTNDNGGTKGPSDWSLYASMDSVGIGGTGPTVSSDPNFSAGTYVLSETGPSGYTPSSWECEGGTQEGDSITLGLGQSATCTIINNDQAGTLIVKKVVVNDNGGTKDANDFSFSVNEATATAFEADGQNDLTVSAGTYNITEPEVAGYTTTYDNCSNLNIPNGGSETCTITNNDQSGTLIVKKVVINDNGGTLNEEDFSFQVGTGSAVPFEADGQNDLTVDAGTYTVTEPAVEGYDATHDNCTRITVVNGGTQTCTITNDDQAATIIVIKNVINDNGGTKNPGDFIMHINGISVGVGISFAGATGAGVSTQVNAGSFTVSEDSVSGYSDSFSGDCSGSIANGGTKTCTFTNNDQSGHLIVHKITDPSSDTTTVFPITASGTSPVTDPTRDITGGSSIDYTVDAGTYSVSEATPSGWTTTGDNCQGIAVANGETQECTITNTKYAQITVLKNAVPNDVQDFTFTDTFGNGNPASFTLDDDGNDANTYPKSRIFDVLPGTFSVTEATPSGWKQFSASCDNQDSPSEITVTAGQQVTCTFVNHKLGSITLVKNTVGGDGTFDFVMTGDSLDSGAQLITVGGTATQTFTGIDPDNTYTINELDEAGWDLTDVSCRSETGASKNPEGFQINNGGTVTCTFTNTKRGHIIVDKITDPSGDLQSFDFEASGSGYLDFSLADTDAPNDQELVPGTYSVSETIPIPNGWDQTGATCDNQQTPGSITLGAGETVHCTFTNTKRGHLTVQKTTLPGGEPDLFTIQATGSGTIFDSTSPYISDGLGMTSTYTVTPGTYYVTEDQLDGWDKDDTDCQRVVVGAGEDVTCTISNTKRGSISGTKYEVNSDRSPVGVLSGWVISLFNGDTKVAETTTDEFGNFSFTNLVQGIYTLAEDLLSGWTQIFSPSSVNLNPGDSSIDNNFENFLNGTIEGYKFNDINGDSEWGEDDYGLEAWVIFIDQNGNGVLDEGEVSQETDGDGFYSFSDLGPGTYSICEQEQAGWQRTLPSESNCQSIEIATSGQNETAYFGNQGRGTVTVLKDVDSDGDGTVDITNAQGWTWNIADVAQDIPTGGGSPQEVVAGTYYIQENQQEGYHVSSLSCDDGNIYEASEGLWVEISPGGNLICTFTNTRNTGFIEVHKKVDDGSGNYRTGDSGANELGFRWTLNGGDQREMGTNATVPTGDKHEINENTLGGYVFTGWYETGSEDFSCNNPESTTLPVSLTVIRDLTRSITLCNQLQNPILTINKSNNTGGADKNPGGNVLFTITVEATQSAVLDVKVKDLPSAGFKYKSGSWTATSNLNPSLSITEPIYASPGSWSLGNMAVGEIITLTYIADIDSGTDPGLYKDLAWAQGKSLSDSTVLANAENPGFVSDNFVGTSVNVVKDEGSSTGVNVETIEEGEVLGASISLPSTGAATIWLVLAGGLAGFGVISLIYGIKLRRKHD